MNIVFGALRLWQKCVSHGAVLCVPRMNVHLSGTKMLKEIRETQVGNVRVFEGVNIPSPREPYVVNTGDPRGCCTICSLGLEVKHTDVLILSQFLRTDGCMLPRRITGLCRKQQKRITYMVAMAQKAGLMSNIGPPGSKRDPKKRFKWKKCNTYFEESTIKDVKSIVDVRKKRANKLQ